MNIHSSILILFKFYCIHLLFFILVCDGLSWLRVQLEKLGAAEQKRNWMETWSVDYALLEAAKHNSSQVNKKRDKITINQSINIRLISK